MYLLLEVAECIMADYDLEQMDRSAGHVLYWEAKTVRRPALVLPLYEERVNAGDVVEALEERGVPEEKAMDSLARCCIGKEILLRTSPP